MLKCGNLRCKNFDPDVAHNCGIWVEALHRKCGFLDLNELLKKLMVEDYSGIKKVLDKKQKQC